MDYDVVIGLDVGKTAHHACALDQGGKRLVDREITNTESSLRAIFTSMAAQGRVLTRRYDHSPVV